MAKNSQGVSVTLSDWYLGDIDFTEVVSVSLDGVQADAVEITSRSSLDPVKRYRPADRDNGTASLVMRTQNSMTDAVVGKTCSLDIYAGATSYWSGPAIVQSLAWRATVGELQEYSMTFKLGAS